MMDTAERDDRVMTIAAEALQKPLAERESFLRAACQNDSDLYQEVSEVVTWEERMSTFLHRPLIDLIDIDSLGKPFTAQQTINNRFDILREIGDGGMGVVYEAYDNERKQRIAIKCAKPGFSRLQSPELNGALKVRHHNVCQLNDIHMVSTDLGDLRFITMELLDGETLQNRLSRGKLDPVEAMKFARELCAGVAEAHRCGVVHGDLKPANIILAHGEKNEARAVITDFGLSVNQDADSGLLGGTPSYMAPELKKGSRVSTASDVYALGVILYEMVTGQKPFSKTDGTNNDEKSPEVSIQAVNQRPVRPSKLDRQLPQIWDDAILPCLATLPDKRPSAKQVIAVIDREPVYRRPWVSIVPIAALVVLATGAFLWRPVYNYFRTPDITLAILPAQGDADFQSKGNEVLSKTEAPLEGEPGGTRKVKILPPAVAANKGLSTKEEAGKRLHATHVLEVKFRHDTNGVVVDADVNSEKSVPENPDDPHRHYSAHFSEGNLDDLPGALASLVSASLHMPRSAMAEAISPAAKVAYDKGKHDLEKDDYSYDAAILEFQEAARLDPHSPLPLAGLAESYILKRSVEKNPPLWKKVEPYVVAATQLNPDSPRVLLASASLNSIKRQKGQAVRDAARVLELEPGNAEAWVRFGLAKEGQHYFDQAQAAYRKAIELAPDYYKPYEYLGAFNYYSQANYAEAEKFYVKAKELAPKRLEGYANLGALLTVQARYREAENIYHEALSIKETPQNLNNLGANLAYEKRDKEAIYYYERAIQLAQQGVDFYLINLADAQRRLGHAKEANENYRKALDLANEQVLKDPDSAQEHAFKAYCLARLHKNDAEFEIGEAWAHAQNNSNISGDAYAQVLKFRVLTYEALGKRPMALDMFKKAPTDIKKELEHHPDLADFNH
jgi:serine/threonine protein kinase/tetratricopeptide (TPR) repeat protein